MFERRVGEDGIEVWVAQVGPFANVNTAFIDRATNTVVIVDPQNAKKWLSALEKRRFNTHSRNNHSYTSRPCRRCQKITQRGARN